MTRYTLATALLIGLVHPLPAAEPAPTSKEIRNVVVKALPLIQKGSAGHRTQRSCFACHHQAVPLLAMTVAQSHGVPIDADEVEKHLRFIAKFLAKNRQNYLQGRGQGGQVDTAGYALWTLEMGGWKADETTAAVTEYLLLRHKDRDHWGGVSNRPPSEASPFTTNYVAVRALRSFGTVEQKKRIDERLRSVRGWLEKAATKDTEDRVFRLWSLKIVNGEAKDVSAAAQTLIAEQRADGGWAQREGMESDAYATGTALVALREAGGLAASDAVYQRGANYLMTTQREDGTWHVRSRSKPFQSYFESGFPYGKDQFISLAASGWATTALALALPDKQSRDCQGAIIAPAP